MKVKFKKNFLKDLERLPKEVKGRIETLVFHEIPGYKSLEEVVHTKKIRGRDTYYRARIGDYRIGFLYVNKVITFLRVLHRKDIYKYFP